MGLRLALVCGLFLFSFLLWPPEGSFVHFRLQSHDVLIRMMLAVWVWVAAVLASEYQVLDYLRARRKRGKPNTPAQPTGWAGAFFERRGKDRRKFDRRQRAVPLPEGMPDRRHAEDRRHGGRRGEDQIRS